MKQRLLQRLPQPTPPPLPLPTSARRGYGQALIFFALLFGVYATTAILGGAAQWSLVHGLAVWVDRWLITGLWMSLAAMAVWLAAARSRHCRIWALLFVCAVVGEALTTGGRMNSLGWLFDVLSTIAAVFLAATIARQHGLTIADLGIGRPRGDHSTRSQAVTVFWGGFTSNAAAAVLGIAIVLLGLPQGIDPIKGYTSPFDLAIHMIAAGTGEELLMAVVVVALTAARRPAWKIYALSTSMRISYHMYYQVAGLSLLPMGLINVWLYRRTGRLTPIIIAHIVWDLMSWARYSGGMPLWAASYAVLLVGETLVGAVWVGKPAPDSEQEPAPAAAQP